MEAAALGTRQGLSKTLAVQIARTCCSAAASAFRRSSLLGGSSSSISSMAVPRKKKHDSFYTIRYAPNKHLSTSEFPPFRPAPPRPMTMAEEEEMNRELDEQEKLIREVWLRLPSLTIEAWCIPSLEYACPSELCRLGQHDSADVPLLTIRFTDSTACAVRKTVRGNSGHCRRRCAIRRDRAHFRWIAVKLRLVSSRSSLETHLQL